MAQQNFLEEWPGLREYVQSPRITMTQKGKDNRWTSRAGSKKSNMVKARNTAVPVFGREKLITIPRSMMPNNEGRSMLDALRSKAAMLNAGVTVDSRVMAGTPVVKGTRTPLYMIFDYLSEGFSIDQIREYHPALTDENIKDALRFASFALNLDKD
ncbi:MAG TPA: DUF433 domain-containing protein [Spirochaetia bacterium]|nr:DUF433 domain-containing protein [Spirochaetia bacterium]